MSKLTNVKSNKNDKCKISVIMPCYNTELYIKECLNSVLNQNFTNFEVICIDDGSTDKTLQILRQFEKKDKRVKVVSQKNKSAGTARNNGIKLSCGEFLYFMDSDDFLDENAFSVLLDATKYKSCDTYMFSFKTFDDVTHEKIEKKLFTKFNDRFTSGGGEFLCKFSTYKDSSELLLWSNVAPWNKLYNAKFVKENGLVFDEIFSTNDRTFYFSALSKSKSIMFIDFSPINYRINNNTSLTGTYDENKFNNRVKAYRSSAKFIDFDTSIISDSFFKVTIQDFLSFFQKTNEENKFSVFLKTIEFFKTIETKNAESSTSKTNKFGFWYNFFIESDYLLNKPAEEIVPIVFATNDKYLPYLSVALKSLTLNSSKDKFYDIYIFESSLSELNKYKILSMQTENIHIRVINILSLVKDISMYTKGYFSVEMYYRIMIPDLLYAYKKVLYLDCDIVINKDVSELYDTEISDYVLAGIINKLHSTEMTNYVLNILKLPKEEYFNSGILLFNINKFKEDCIKKKCFEYVAKYPRLACPDQDVLNLSCNGSVLYLDEKWNFQTGCEGYTNEQRYGLEKYIIHYTTGNKPWNKKDLPLAEYFWQYARQTPYYEDILANYVASTKKIDVAIGACGTNDKFHYRVINENVTNGCAGIKKKHIITWPLRMIRSFFVSLKKNGFKRTMNLTKEKLVYVKNRTLGRVDKYNNFYVKKDVKKDYNYYKNLKIKDYPKEIESWYNKIKKENFTIKKPETFNQKIQWLKIYDSTLLKSHLTDKWLAKEYVKNVLGEKYIIKTIGVYDKFEDIDFSKLPKQFVIKSTHGSGQIEIVKDKNNLDLEKLKQKVESWLSTNYAFKGGFELHYHNIIPRIIIEEFMSGINDDLYDYKIMCINGKPEFLWVDSNRFVDHRRNLYDINWNLLPVTYCYKNSDNEIEKPKQLQELLKLSQKLAQPFALVRCDFYLLKDGSIKFGELTFTSCSGLDPWNPIQYDFEYGKILKLPRKTRFKKLSKSQIEKSEKTFLKNIGNKK